MDSPIPSHVPRHPLNIDEANQLIIMKIHVTSIERPGPDDGQDLPVVHYEGKSRSMDTSFDYNSDSDIRGKHYHSHLYFLILNEWSPC